MQANLRKTLNEVVTREYTIHLHKHVFGKTFKKRAPHAIKVIKQFATKQMKTKLVVINPNVNAEIWKNGVKSVPHRIRVRLERKRNDKENSTEKLITHVSIVPIAKSSDFKGLETVTIYDD